MTDTTAPINAPALDELDQRSAAGESNATKL